MSAFKEYTMMFQLNAKLGGSYSKAFIQQCLILLFFAAELIQSMKKALLPPFASGGTTHRLRTYSLQGSAVPAARKAAAPG